MVSCSDVLSVIAVPQGFRPRISLNRFLQIDILIELGIEKSSLKPQGKDPNEICEDHHGSFSDLNVGDHGNPRDGPDRESTSTSQPNPTDPAQSQCSTGGRNHYPRSDSQPVSLSTDQPVPCSHAVSNEGRALYR